MLFEAVPSDSRARRCSCGRFLGRSLCSCRARPPPGWALVLRIEWPRRWSGQSQGSPLTTWNNRKLISKDFDVLPQQLPPGCTLSKNYEVLPELGIGTQTKDHQYKQYTHRRKHSTADTISVVIYQALTCLENKDSYVRQHGQTDRQTDRQKTSQPDHSMHSQTSYKYLFQQKIMHNFQASVVGWLVKACYQVNLFLFWEYREQIFWDHGISKK